MKQHILCGCDLHDESMSIAMAANQMAVEYRTYPNSRRGRAALFEELQRRAAEAGEAEVHLVYEASGLGFILHDEAQAAGLHCSVLAPTRIQRSPQERKNKTDRRDALKLLELIRAHVLAGAALPSVWVPDVETRDHREVTRQYLCVKDQITAAKTRVRTLIKRSGVIRPEEVRTPWTRSWRRWLAGLSTEGGGLRWGARLALQSLLRQIEALEGEVQRLYAQVELVLEQPRWKAIATELIKTKGVGMITAAVYATEIGDFRRFRNRRQVGAYLGAAPSAHESGERSERKGHITRQGPPRIRRALCQAAWSRVRTDEKERAVYARVVERNPRNKKIALVASMRRLGIHLWHIGREVQQAA